MENPCSRSHLAPSSGWKPELLTAGLWPMSCSQAASTMAQLQRSSRKSLTRLAWLVTLRVCGRRVPRRPVAVSLCAVARQACEQGSGVAAPRS